MEEEEEYNQDNSMEGEENNDNNNTNSILNEEKTDIEIIVSNVINKLFASENYVPLQKLLNKDFINNLVNFSNNCFIEVFLLNDFDKMVIIKELLTELEYCNWSIINNIFFNFGKIFISSDGKNKIK
jgi:hypothetical protein